MAISSTYCTHRDVKDIFPNIDDFDSKTPIYGWESLGNNVYVAHNVGLVTQLFADGKVLNPTVQAGAAAGAFYKSSLTATLDVLPDNDTLSYNVLNYNAGAFSTGAETDIQVGDYIRLDDSSSSPNEYAFVEAVNTGTNQITIRRGAIDTLIISWTTGNSATFEDYIRVSNANQWYYDSHYDQVLLYSASDPNDMLIESGDDFSTLMTRIMLNASRYVDARIDANLPRDQFKDKEGNFDYMIVRTTALCAAYFLVNAQDPTNPIGDDFMDEVNFNIDQFNSGKSRLSGNVTGDASKGIVREVVAPQAANALHIVDTRGHYNGIYDLLKVVINTAGVIGTSKFDVYGRSTDNLKTTQIVTAEIINGQYQSIGNGLQVRFAGKNSTSSATLGGTPDEWEIEVFGKQESIDDNIGQIRSTKMSRRG